MGMEHKQARGLYCEFKSRYLISRQLNGSGQGVSGGDKSHPMGLMGPLSDDGKQRPGIQRQARAPLGCRGVPRPYGATSGR
jgi:hypothetical protein